MADLRRPRGRSSSLRCGRSTSTPTVGPPSSSTGENEAKTNANQRTLTFTGVPNTDKETYGEPRESVTVDRSSSLHEGAADGQPRQDPTDRPAYTWRTPCHADSDRRFRRCYCCRLDGMGNNRPLAGPLRPIG